MDGLFGVGGLLGPIAPGMSGAVNPLAMMMSGLASGDPGAALAQMGRMQQAAAALQSNEEYRDRVMAMREEQFARQEEAARVAAQHRAAQNQAAVTAAQRLFPGLPVEATQAIAPKLLDQYAGEYVKSMFAQPGEEQERRMEKDVAGMWRYVDTGERVFPGTEMPPEPQKYSDVSGMRKEFEGHAKPFEAAKKSYQRIMDAQPTGAGDTSMVYAFAKINDPSGVVTDADARAALASGGLGSQIMGYWNQLQGSGKLDEKAREEIRQAAGNILRGQVAGQDEMQARYAQLASDRGWKPESVVRDVVGEGLRSRLENVATIAEAQRQEAAPAMVELPPGLQERVNKLLQSRAAGQYPQISGYPGR